MNITKHITLRITDAISSQVMKPKARPLLIMILEKQSSIISEYSQSISMWQLRSDSGEITLRL